MRRRVGWLLASLIAAVALASIWAPIARRYWVATPSLNAAVVQGHRFAPSSATLAALAEQSLMSDNPIGGERTIPLADRFLAGRLEYPLMGGIDITPTFAPADLAKGSDVVQFLSAGWIGPDWLLRAYELTGRDAYFDTAQRYILGFIEFERRQWLPHASIWATNALATRAGVLARFWRLYRGRADYDATIGARILQHAARVGELLARPASFIGTSNHGVMQNIGLLQIATAFAQLPESARLAQLAQARLAEQLRFYVSDEGVVLEHSAGYHFSGVRLLAYVRELHELRGDPMPQAWATRQQGALAFFRFLQRPDRTLPMFGNTLSMPWTLPVFGLGPSPLPDAAHVRAPAGMLHPVSGYAAWWDAPRDTERRSTLVQTVVPWSFFPGHAHKLADEMSMLLWADGHSWITNVGYAPYHGALAGKAAGWTGSTAPHFVDEKPDTARETRLRAYLDEANVRALDLERINADGSRVRRQIVTAGGRWWIVLDSAEADAARPFATQWTTYPGTRVTAEAPPTAPGNHAHFRLSREDSTHAITLHAVTGGAGTIEPLQGSTAPYAGWAVVDRRPTPTQSVRVATEAQHWILTVFALEPADSSARSPAPAEAVIESPQRWRITLTSNGRPITVSRNAMRLTSAEQSFALQPGRDVTEERAAISAAFNAVRERYPRVRDLLDYRWRASVATVAGWVALVLALATSMARRRPWLGAALSGLYAAGCAWLLHAYLG